MPSDIERKIITFRFGEDVRSVSMSQTFNFKLLIAEYMC